MIPGQLPNDTLNKIKNGLGADDHQIEGLTAERNADILDDPLDIRDRMDEAPGQGFGVAGLGAGANNVTDYSHAAPLDTETGIIPKNDCNYVTVDGSKKVRIRYYYVGLHNGYTEEQRNFTVYDEVWFEQPSPETIKQIKQEQTNEEEHLKQEQANTKHMPCATVFKNKCNTNGITTECPHCGHFFCSWHIKVNNGLLPGGHVCY